MYVQTELFEVLCYAQEKGEAENTCRESSFAS